MDFFPLFRSDTSPALRFLAVLAAIVVIVLTAPELASGRRGWLLLLAPPLGVACVWWPHIVTLSAHERESSVRVMGWILIALPLLPLLIGIAFA